MTTPLNDNNQTNPTIPFRFTRLYVLTLIGLAMLLTMGQVLTQWRMNAVQDELYIIRITALQRNQSQQIVKKALQLADPKEAANFAENQDELREIFAQFESNHLQSREGRFDNENVVIAYTDSVQRLYQTIRPHFEAIQRSTRTLLSLRQPDDINNQVGQFSRQLLLTNEKPFLEQIDAIARLCTADLRYKLTKLQYLELTVYLLTIIVMVSSGYLIFKPAVEKLRQTIAQLVAAEQNTAAINKKLLVLNRSLKATRQKLFEATKQQHQQELTEQKLRTSYLIAGQEEERKRLSRELHDGLGQMLTAIKLQVEALETALSRMPQHDQAGVPLHNIVPLKNLITQTIQETRMISNNLMPSVLSDFGIVPALKMLAEATSQRDATEVTFETNLPMGQPGHSQAGRIDKNVEITLYRVTQEAVSNAVRHGKPAHIQIELFDKDGYVHLIVTDDGKGFRQQRLKQPQGQGVHNMHERVKLLNGKFRINSVLGKGTKVQVSVPFNSQHVTHEHHHINAGG